MKVNYDRDTDTMTITLREERIKESDELRDGIVVDYGYDGKIVRIEILAASETVANTEEMLFAIEA